MGRKGLGGTEQTFSADPWHSVAHPARPQAATENRLFTVGSKPQTEGFHHGNAGHGVGVRGCRDVGCPVPCPAPRDRVAPRAGRAEPPRSSGGSFGSTFAVGNCSMNINGQVPQDAAGPQQLAGAWEGRGKVAPRASRCALFAQQTPRAPSAAAPAGCAERCLHGRRTSSVLSRQRRTPTEQLGSGHASGTPRSPRNVA